VAVEEIDGYLVGPTSVPIPAEMGGYERSMGLIAVRFPLFLSMPGPGYSWWLQVIPTGPEKHRLIAHLMAPLATVDLMSDENHQEALTFFDSFQKEDAAVNGRVQRLMHSKYAKGGVLHDQEIPLLILQRYLAEMLGKPTDA
jgi:hypothetical protein